MRRHAMARRRRQLRQRRMNSISSFFRRYRRRHLNTEYVQAARVMPFAPPRRAQPPPPRFAAASRRFAQVEALLVCHAVVVDAPRAPYSLSAAMPPLPPAVIPRHTLPLHRHC